MAMEALLSIPLEIALEKIEEVIWEDVELSVDATIDLLEIGKKLKSIKAVLADAERKQITDESVRVWLSTLKGITLDIEDVVEEWQISCVRGDSDAESKEVVLKLDINDAKGKQKAMKVVSGISGIDSITIDMKTKNLTVIGNVDPVSIAKRLRKFWPATAIVSVGPAKEPEKKEEAKKEEAKKEEAKKEEPKKEEAKKEEAKKEEPKKEEAKKEEPKKEEPKKEEEKKKTLQELQIEELLKAYKAYNPHLTTYYYHPSIEENPNACVIC